MTGILCHPSLKQKSAPPPEILSDEARAQIVSDAMGRFSEGDARKRVFDAALAQIRNAKAQQISSMGRT